MLGLLGVGGLPLYYLYDAFTDTVAAGSVNGTLSTPPANVLIQGAIPARTVTDTNSLLSIGSGLLTIAVGTDGAAAGDPGIWYSSIARLLGRILIATYKPVSSTSRFARFGWDNNQSGLGDTCFDLQNQTLFVRDSNGTAAKAGAFVDGTTYQLAISERTTGYYWFIKGGAFVNWSLLWQSAVGTVSPLYPSYGDSNLGSNSLQSTLANLRVPVALYIPPPLAYDTFTRANGALGSTETTGPDAQATPALAWTVNDGTIVVASNKASDTVLGGDSQANATVNTSSSDVVIDADVTRTAGSAGVMARWADANNYLIAYVDGTNCKLDKVVAGTTTNLISAAVTYSAGKTLRLILSGTSARLFYNGAAVGSVATVPASSATAHGLWDNDLSALWDNFQVFPRGTANEYAGLDLL